MSAISSKCIASIVLADYASIDGEGKANIIGGGISFIGFNPQDGLSAPFALYVQISAEVSSSDENQAAIEVVLQDIEGNPIMLPGPTGAAEPMRMAQAVEFSVVQPPGTTKPPADFPALTNFVLNFSNGLPLQLGEHYKWVVKVDGDEKASEHFSLPKPQAPPVFG